MFLPIFTSPASSSTLVSVAETVLMIHTNLRFQGNWLLHSLIYVVGFFFLRSLQIIVIQTQLVILRDNHLCHDQQ